MEMGYRRPISVIPNICAVPALRLLDSIDKPSGSLVIDISDDDRRKNMATLVRAFAKVRTRVPAATLRLIGPGLGPQGRLAGWARSQQLAEGVEFLGPLPSGLPKDEFLSRVQTAIEDATARLVEAGRKEQEQLIGSSPSYAPSQS